MIWFGNVSVYNRFGHKNYATSTGKGMSSESMKTIGLAIRKLRTVYNNYICMSYIAMEKLKV